MSSKAWGLSVAFDHAPVSEPHSTLYGFCVLPPVTVHRPRFSFWNCLLYNPSCQLYFLIPIFLDTWWANLMSIPPVNGNLLPWGVKVADKPCLLPSARQGEVLLPDRIFCCRTVRPLPNKPLMSLNNNNNNFRPCFFLGFPGGSHHKESACNAEDLGSVPGLNRSPREENGNSLQNSSLENSMDKGA